MKILVEVFEDALEPTCLETIFKKCSNLKTLRHMEVNLYRNNKAIVNGSITDLNIQFSTVPEGWDEIKYCLPNLTNLTLTHVDCINVMVIY
jgi:hypothetical protein